MKGGVCRSIERYREFFFILYFFRVVRSGMIRITTFWFLHSAWTASGAERCECDEMHVPNVQAGWQLQRLHAMDAISLHYLHWRWCEPVTAPESMNNMQTLQISNIDQHRIFRYLRYLYSQSTWDVQWLWRRSVFGIFAMKLFCLGQERDPLAHTQCAKRCAVYQDACKWSFDHKMFLVSFPFLP